MDMEMVYVLILHRSKEQGDLVGGVFKTYKAAHRRAQDWIAKNPSWEFDIEDHELEG